MPRDPVRPDRGRPPARLGSGAAAVHGPAVPGDAARIRPDGAGRTPDDAADRVPAGVRRPAAGPARGGAVAGQQPRRSRARGRVRQFPRRRPLPAGDLARCRSPAHRLRRTAPGCRGPGRAPTRPSRPPPPGSTIPRRTGPTITCRTLFPPVRPRGGYLEIRYLDAQPVGRIAEAVAAVAALTLDPAPAARRWTCCCRGSATSTRPGVAAATGECPDRAAVLAIARAGIRDCQGISCRSRSRQGRWAA